MLKDKHGWWFGLKAPDVKNISFNIEIIHCTIIITAQGFILILKEIFLMSGACVLCINSTDHFIFVTFLNLGHSPRGTEVQSYIPLRNGGSCVVGTPPTCTAMGVSDTEWRLHVHHTYYVTVKAENSAGLTSYAVSDPYIHDVQTAARGIVLDILASSVSTN